LPGMVLVILLLILGEDLPASVVSLPCGLIFLSWEVTGRPLGTSFLLGLLELLGTVSPLVSGMIRGVAQFFLGIGFVVFSRFLSRPMGKWGI